MRPPLLVRTFREGAAARLGHDLVLEATRWEADVERDGAGRLSSVRVTVDPRSLEVREATGGVRPLTEGDRDEIRRNIDAKVLRGMPITFASSAVRGAEIVGDLTIAGRTRQVTLRGDTPLRLRQSEWGIKPFRGLMGALKVRDEVEIAVDFSRAI